MHFKTFLIFIGFISCAVSGQNYNGLVAYDYAFTNGAVNFQKEYILHFDKNKSIYIETLNDQREDEGTELKVKENYGTYNIKIGGDDESQFYFYDNRNQDFYFRVRILDEMFTVKENNNLYQWQVTDSIRIISGFKSQMATTNFRGRKYIAWFTNEIPVPYGPWKFHGLNGLILEVYDTTGLFHVTATRVNITDEKDGINMEEIGKILNSKNNILNIKEYLAKKDEKSRAMLEKINSRLPQGMEPFTVDKDCEDCGEDLEIFND